MENKEIQEHILKKWLVGNLSPQELDELRKHKDFEVYKTILEESRHLKISSFDKEKAFEELWNKILKEEKVIAINQNQKSSRSKKWIIPLSAVASVAALLLVTVMISKKDDIIGPTVPNTLVRKISKENCEKLILPDGSIVEMDKGAEVSYDTASFATQRQIKVSGDVFLRVKKGSSFDVLTEQANVGVLGTSFSVYNSHDGFQSFCSTGRVKVALPDNSQSVILKPGMGVELVDGGLKQFMLNNPKPKNEGIYFSDKSLFEVFTELANYNKVKFKFSGDAGMRTFSGSLNPHDLGDCLKSIQESTKITWEREGNIIEIK